jgi:riboflavin biosynthesis pyrimidine reductase
VQNDFHVSARFEAYCQRKTEAAIAAPVPGFATVTTPASHPPRQVVIGNDWSRRLFDGWFYRTAAADERRMPAVGLVFVQSADGNTGAQDPSTLGAGETDKHLVYEGLTRVDTDAVLAGATTAADDEVVFSVWHPEMVRLRLERDLPRHPVQVILTERGDLPVHKTLLYNEPSLRVIVIASTPGAVVLERRLPGRPWVEVIDGGQPVNVRRALATLYERGIKTISAIGGRRTAATLMAEGLVSELYLTTSPQRGGEPNTPLVEGSLPPHRVLLEKEGKDGERGVRFQHLVFESTDATP